MTVSGQLSVASCQFSCPKIFSGPLILLATTHWPLTTYIVHLYCPRITADLHVAGLNSTGGARRSGPRRWKNLVGKRVAFLPSLATKQDTIQFLYQADELFWILLTTSSFRKRAPILNLSFHCVTSKKGCVALVSCISCAKVGRSCVLCSLAEGRHGSPPLRWVITSR